jgi:hypothetical protein
MNGDFIPLEDFVNKVALYKNASVIGFFDCCRVNAPPKGELDQTETPFNFHGRYIKLFTTVLGK